MTISTQNSSAAPVRSAERAVHATGWVLIALAASHVFVMVEPVKSDVGGFISPILEYVHTGRVVYPAHGPDHADAMIVHPPTYYWLAGVLMRAGMPLFPALGTLVLIMAVVAVASIVRAPFSPELRLGLLWGVYIPNFVLVDLDAIRPELQMALGWIAGLVVLESARLRGWKPWPLAIGSFLICYSCSLHYFAWPGIAATMVYGIWVLVTEPVNRWPAIRAIALGAGAYVVPFAALFAIPEREGIAAIITALKPLAVTGTAAAPGAFAYHRMTYEASYAYLTADPEFRSLFLVVAAPVLRWGIPAVVIAFPLLCRWRQTRGLAIAALTVLLPILIVVTHKSLPYYRMELTLLYAALVAAALTLVRILAVRFASGPRIALASAAMMLVAVGLADFRGWSILRGHRFVDEIAVQRTVAEQFLGAGAVVGGRSVTQWFTSGGAAYRFVTTDVIYPPDVSGIDAAYFAEMDAIAEDPQGSWATYNKQRKVLSSYYLDGTLRLGLVYFGRPTRGATNDFFLTTVRDRNPRRAYFWRGDTLLMFRERAGGASALMSAEVADQNTIDRFRADAEAVSQYGLPRGSNVVLAFFIGNAPRLRHASDNCAQCQTRDFVEGDVTAVDSAALLSGFDYRRERAIVVHSRPEAMAFRMIPDPDSAPTAAVFEATGRDVATSGTADEQRFEIPSTNGSGVIATTPAISLDPAMWYEVSLRLAVLSGQVRLVATDGVHRSTPFAELNRPHVRPMTEERFAITGAPSLRLGLERSGSGSTTTAASVGRVTVRRVIPRP